MVKWVEIQIHLTAASESVPPKLHEQWIKIDSQLCCVIKSNIHTLLKPIFQMGKKK